MGFFIAMVTFGIFASFLIELKTTICENKHCIIKINADYRGYFRNITSTPTTLY